jgi:hypothetical protein
MGIVRKPVLRFAVPVLTTRLGLNWQPPDYPTFRLFVGYQLDYWWNTGRFGIPPVPTPFEQNSYFFDSGIVLRGEWSF